jgi:hypothetical protein
MNQKIKEAAQAILEELKELRKTVKVTSSYSTLEKNLLYFFRREGVKLEGGRTAGRPVSKLAMKYKQEGRESTIFRGTLKEALKQREEALADPEALEQKLKEAQEETEALEDAATEDAQVLATSEQKPKKRRGRKPKAKPEGEAED